ncbi:hypothetical protein T02_1807 [Trichinella nativa]|uniref:Uncharacterized protein n=1 Tax=Trichinella nativa TaxID=6335 RepID=A0A0V1KP71_9BILA|nr:hypothetical protein T02_1807 [Trichinella nativa]
MLWARIKPGLIALLEELNFMESFNDFLTVLINMYCVSKVGCDCSNLLEAVSHLGPQPLLLNYGKLFLKS